MNEPIFRRACLSAAVAFMLLACAGPTRSADSASLEIVSAFESVLADVIEKSRASVVTVYADRSRGSALRRAFEFDGPRRTSGTAFVYRADGYLLTNDHVVHGAQTVEARFSDGREYDARVVGSDPNTDIAVLKIDEERDFPALPLADSDAARVGQFAISVGNPLRLDFSANIGIISAKGRANLIPNRNSDLIRYQDFIQTDAYMNQGNSGGPLMNLRGEVVGINSMIRTRGADSDEYIGIGFAVPSNIARLIGDQLIERGRVVRGWLGIEYRTTDGGVRVTYVGEDSPAERSGLRRQDVITEVDGRPFRDENADDIREQFRWLIAMAPVGASMPFTVTRGDKTVRLDVVLGEMPAEYSGQEELRYPLLTKLGVRGYTLLPNLAAGYGYARGDKGVILTEVNRRSPAAQVGLEERHLVIEVDGRQVATPEDFEKELERAARGDSDYAILRIKSFTEDRELEVTLDALRDE